MRQRLAGSMSRHTLHRLVAGGFGTCAVVLLVVLNSRWNGGWQHLKIPGPFVQAPNVGGNSYEDLPEKRVVFTHFVSSERVNELSKYWEGNSMNLYRGRSNSSSVLITFPGEESEAITARLVQKLSLVEQGRFAHQCPICMGSLKLFRDPNNVDVLLQGVNVYLPPKLLDKKRIEPKCAGRSWSLSYALYSGAFFSYHAVQLPILRRFAYFMKIDSDIGFYQRVPQAAYDNAFWSGGQIIQSAILPSVHCNAGSTNAVREYAQHMHLEPLSLQYEWCNPGGESSKVGLIFYGNFVGFSMDLVNRFDEMAEWLYLTHVGGYFGARWGDQAPWMIYTCFYLDIPDIRNDPQVTDISSWRDEYFKHY